MSESPCCPKCGIQLPADAPAGLCPKCLVQAGFESQPASQPGPTVLTPPNSGFVPPTVEELAPLFPQLEILELLGKGGMGAVYKARQPGLDRLVALKILPPEISRDPAFTERFQREARALAKLSHPHIVAVYDFGTTEASQASGGRQPPGSADDQLNRGADAPRSPSASSLCYIVMEFVDGANLRQTIRTGKLTSADALAIVPQICEALQFAHDEGIVHRDIKPENILIDKRGRVKIADFGLAKLLGTDASDHSLTATHQVMGTLRYMAPEQMQGSREVDHRADIYSLGVVFYELLTGEIPMGKFAPPSKRVHIDVRLDEIVLRALEQDPEQRYQHASEVKTDVETISRSPSVARPESAKRVDGPSDARATPPAQPHVFSGQTYFVVVLSVLALVGLAMWFGQSAWWLLALFVPETMIAALMRPDELRTLGSRLRLLTVVLAILGLIAFAMWLEQSPWPLLALVIFSVPIVAASVKDEDETPGNETTGTRPVSSPPAHVTPTPFADSGRATQPRRRWLLPRTATLLATLVGGLLVAGPWQSVEIRAPFTQGSHSLWFLSMGYESGLGLAAGVLFAIAFFMTLVAFPLRRVAVPAVTILLGLLITALMIAYGSHPPLVDQPEVADMAARIRSLNPNLQVGGSTDLDVVLTARKARLIDYWQVIIPAFYVCLTMALVTVLAATFDFVLIRQAAAIESSLALEPEPRPFANPVRAAAPSEVAERMAVAKFLVRGPAIGMVAIGVAAWVQSLVIALCLMFLPREYWTWGMLSASPVVAVVGIPYGAVLLAAGLQMRRLQAYTLAVLAGVLASGGPLGVVWIFAVPVAIWAHIVLWKQEVKDAFALRLRERILAIGADTERRQAEHERDAGIERSGEPEGVSPRTSGEQVRGLVPLTHQPQGASPRLPPEPDASAYRLMSQRPKLVPVLATINLVGAIVLMLVCAMEQPPAFTPNVARVWQVWETVDSVLGFAMAAGMFAASIGLFLWKPWARKLTLGVCVFGLASFVFDAPYLARFALPDIYAEIQHTMATEGVDPEMVDVVAMLSVVILVGGMVVVGVAWLIGQLVYFTRPRVVAAFASQGETYGKFLDWLFTGAGAVAGVVAGLWSVFGGLALLLGLAAFFKWSSGEQPVDPPEHHADSKTGEQWSGNPGAEHVLFWGPNSPIVSDRLARHLGLDAAQREAMDQALQMFVREFRALEEQNTQHETDEKGHQITTIAPLLQGVPPLAERFWTELESVLDGRQLTLGRKSVGLQSGMFETGDYVYRIEIWRVGQINPWYHWMESYPGRANVSQNVPSSAPELPEKLRRFWKEPDTPMTDQATLNDRRLMEDGMWKVVRVMNPDIVPPPDPALESFIVFKDGKMTWTSVNKETGKEVGRHDDDIKIDASRTPKRYESVVWATEPVVSTKWIGIYELEGDTLKMYQGPDERWLSSFTAQPGLLDPRKATSYIELQRVPPPDKIE